MNLLWMYWTLVLSPDRRSLSQPSIALVAMNEPTAKTFSGMLRSAWIASSSIARLGSVFFSGRVLASISAKRSLAAELR